MGIKNLEGQSRLWTKKGSRYRNGWEREDETLQFRPLSPWDCWHCLINLVKFTHFSALQLDFKFLESRAILVITCCITNHSNIQWLKNKYCYFITSHCFCGLGIQEGFSWVLLALVSCNYNHTVAGAAGGWLGNLLPGVSGPLHVEDFGLPHVMGASGQWHCLYLGTSKASFPYWW